MMNQGNLVSLDLPPTHPLNASNFEAVFGRTGDIVSTTGTNRLCRRGKAFIGSIQREAGRYGILEVQGGSGRLVVRLRSGMRAYDPLGFIERSIAAHFGGD